MSHVCSLIYKNVPFLCWCTISPNHLLIVIYGHVPIGIGVSWCWRMDGLFDTSMDRAAIYQPIHRSQTALCGMLRLMARAFHEGQGKWSNTSN